MTTINNVYTMTVKKAIKALENLVEHKEEKAKHLLDQSQSWNKDCTEDYLPHKAAETISEMLYRDIGYLQYVIKQLEPKSK